MHDEIGRDSWTVMLPTNKVLAAARTKKKFHQARVQHWLVQRTKAEKTFKKNGLKVVANIFNTTSGTSYSVASTSNMKQQVAQVDNKLLQDWQDANIKAEQHKNLVRRYEKWIQFFGAGKIVSTLDLTMDDAEFFGLVKE